MCKKPRHLKTLYERFSHHKVENLNDFTQSLKEKLNTYYAEATRHKIVNSDNPMPTNIFEVLSGLNVLVNGTFYVNGVKDGEFNQDAEVFRDIWERIRVAKHFSSTDDKFLKVQVVRADFKDAVLVIYENTRTLDGYYNIQIIRDKHSEFLLEGNVAHLVD